MTLKLGVLMDPIGSIHYKKDSTLAMLWEAKARGYELYYFEQADLFLRDSIPYAAMSQLDVFRDEKRWYDLHDKRVMPLSELNILLMRKDPPFNDEYVYTTHLLDHAEQLGVLVVNRPQSLRDANEKLFTAHFPKCTAPMLVSQSITQLRAFLEEHKEIVCKPLHGMGGTSIFYLTNNDRNANVIFETLTKAETTYIVAQQYIPQITSGDKRIILINGEPIPYALARIPSTKDWRGNLAVGATGKVQPLSERDQFICQQVGPVLREKGLYFAGIDVIGDYLTEVNVTSPTGIRELEAATSINIAATLFDCLETLLKK
jgi:glutathione synthase